MGGFSWLARRPAAAGVPTHALFAAQSHSIVDNLVALFEHSRAWNCSNQRSIGENSFAGRETEEPMGLALGHLLKGLETASGVAQACGIEAPLLATCRDSWAAAATRLGSGADQSALIR